MKWYYPFCPDYPHRLNAWKRLKTPFSIKRFVYSFAKSGKLSVWKAQTMQVRLTIGGHRVKFNGIRMYPIDFKMKHYICLSREHAIRVYCNKKFDPSAVKNGWHGWRANAKEHNIALPAQNQLRYYVSDDELDASDPLTEHLIYKE